MSFVRVTCAILILAVIAVAPQTFAKDRRDDIQLEFKPEDGDIVFQTSPSQLGPALEIATGSKITHVGILIEDNDTLFVYEAVGPVRKITLKEWITIGVDSSYCVRRLKHADSLLTPKKLEKMRKVFSKLEGRHYDVQFEWSDDRLYCSELVYKMFDKGAKIKLGEIEKFGDMKLDDPLVQFWIGKYFPDGPNLDEKIVTPVSIYDDSSLVTIYTNYEN